MDIKKSSYKKVILNIQPCHKTLGRVHPTYFIVKNTKGLNNAKSHHGSILILLFTKLKKVVKCIIYIECS